MIDKKQKAVEWYHLKYSVNDHGRDVSLDLCFGDFLILMFEMSDTLDKHGCPIEPA